MTFDWAQIAYIGSPLVTPFWAALNILGGLVLVMWIAAPLMCMHPVVLTTDSLLTPNRLCQRYVLFLHADPFSRGLG